jgi:hypothetical protein
VAVAHRVIGTGIVSALWLGGFAVRADSLEQEPIRAELAAPRSCTESSSFVDRVLGRTRRARRAQSNEPARTFAITITEAAGSLMGTLRVVTVTREIVERKVEARTCGEVVEALALVAALIVDPEALTKPLGEPPEPEPPKEVAVPPSLPLPVALPAPAPAEPITLSAGLAIELASPIAPSVTPVERVWGEVAWHVTGMLRPSLGLGVARASTLVKRNSLAADILWLAARVTVCPLELSESRRISLRPCALVDVGLIRGMGSQAEAVKTIGSAKTTPWVAPGLGLGVALVPLSPLVLKLEAGGTVQAEQTEFVYQASPSSNRKVYSIPLLGWFLGFGAGVRF